MKISTLHIRSLFFVTSLIISLSSYSQIVLGSYDFETGTEGWTSNGANAVRWNSAIQAYSGSFSLRISSNGTSASFDSPLYSLSTYDKIDLKFFFYNQGVDAGEDFQIQYSSNGGVSWTTVATFLAGNVAGKAADYQSGFPGLHYTKTVTIFKTDYTFPLSPLGRFRVINNASSTSDLTFIDYITITGTTYATPATGPGGITSNLDLWLRADLLDGSTVGTDGANVSTWTDNGKGNHAQTQVSGQEPVYRNNTTKNINFNPVIEFENDHNTANGDMQYINTRDELMGTGGFNSNDMFLVVIPDPTITTSMYPLDTFTSNDPLGTTYSEDVTGIGFGAYTSRFDNERLTYCIGTTNEGSSSNPFPSYDNGYGRADTSAGTNFNTTNIINVRHNATNSDMEIFLNSNQIGDITNDIAKFASINNRKYWIGRSQYWNGSFGGRIAEIITYDSRKNDATERNRIESYLGIKYGITLGVNGTSQDYVDSAGNVIWDVSANTGYNYEITGIGRDDASDLNQKQSKSVHETSDGTGLTNAFLTIGLTDIYDTNSDNIASNPTTFNDGDFLTWGNNHADITLAPFTVNVDMSAGISGLSTPVSFIGMQRIWKVVENGSDIPTVKVSIPQDAVRNISPPGSYLMFISDTDIFDPTADYRVMTPDGSGNLEAEYDFDGVKYITFGYAPQVVVERSIYFDGIQDYIDVGNYKNLNPTEFTVSTWIKDKGSTASILSKRDAGYSNGYDLNIKSGKIEMSWNGGSESIKSKATLPVDIWHHVAVIYSGGTANMYVDGVLDQTETGLADPVPTTESFIIAAAGKTGTTDFFEGNIDEVRIWDVALSEDQLHYIMNQEIEDNSSFVNGMVLPTTITKNEVISIPWSDLAGYYPMSIYTYTNTNDHSNNQNQGALRNLDTVDWQTAPLPYETTTNGDWDTNATWLNGNEQTIPGAGSLSDANITVDWNIVQINHNLTMDNTGLPAINNENRSVLGLYSSAATDLQVNTDSGLTVTHYLELDGTIDLEGESQLIQNDGSVLTVGANGSLERDQQGTADTYTYNYWSAPVGFTNLTATNATYESSYRLPDILMDGTNPATPGTINFLTSGYNGTNTNPIGIADYWIWKFANQLDDNYWAWQHVRSTGTILPGEGFTMKGPGTGSILTEQNYVFNGKPNNGTITLSITANNDYLLGNPYASAIDAHAFLNDNPATNGTLYFWEHWGGGSHYLADYQGGYATYNYSGGAPTASYGTNDPDVATGGTPTKLPGRYVPVSQGFFVYSPGGGTLTFENDQRVFEKESGGNSTFVRTLQPTVNYNEDGRMKFRVGFNSINQIHRQLLLTIDDNASENVDWGYDGKLNEDQMDDMYWMIEGNKYVIQGTNTVTEQTVVPLGIHVSDPGMNEIMIDHLENVPDDVKIYIHDSQLEVYHDIRQSNYQVYLTSGQYFERFSLVFTNPEEALSTDEIVSEDLNIYYDIKNNNVIVQNPKLLDINNLELFNILGQSIFYVDNLEIKSYMEIDLPKLNSGTYIVNVSSEFGKTSKKVLIR